LCNAEADFPADPALIEFIIQKTGNDRSAVAPRFVLDGWLEEVNIDSESKSIHEIKGIASKRPFRGDWCFSWIASIRQQRAESSRA